MKPKAFIPELLDENSPYTRDTNSGLVWHQCRQRTLYADTDRSQVVYHSNYLRYFEFGRASLMRDTGYPYYEIEESGFVYPIIKIGLDYYKPLYYDDLMVIYTRPAEIGRVKLRFDYTILHAETNDIICTGFTQHCAMNLKGTPVAIDPDTVHLWESFPR